MLKTAYEIKCEMLIQEMMYWVGVIEKGGDNRGPEVEAFQKAVDGVASREAWCLAFIQFCVKLVDQRFDRLFGGVNPPTWLFKTEHCMTLWDKTPSKARLKEAPHPGCLVLWQYYSADGKPTLSGHVGGVTKILPHQFIQTVEGNTSPDSKTVVREGDGVYHKIRSLTSSGNRMKIKGFLRVWDPDLLQQTPLKE